MEAARLSACTIAKEIRVKRALEVSTPPAFTTKATAHAKSTETITVRKTSTTKMMMTIYTS